MWDLVGQDPRVGCLNKLFARGAVGAVVVADIMNRDTLEAARMWKDQVDQVVTLKSGQRLPMVLLLNKCDLLDGVTADDLEDFMKDDYLEQFAKDNGFVAAIKVSAKTGQNVNISFSSLVREVLLKEFKFDSEAPD